MQAVPMERGLRQLRAAGLRPHGVVQLWSQLLRCWGLSLQRTAVGGCSLGRRCSRRLGMQRPRQLWIGRTVQGKVERRGGGQEAHKGQGGNTQKRRGGGGVQMCSAASMGGVRTRLL